jgi:antitoxin ParD1/3/4
MTTAIPIELEQFVQQQLATGEYQSVDEVVCAGLKVLQEIKRRQEDFRKEVQIGIDQLDRGEGIELDSSDLRRFFDEIQLRGQARYEATRKNS